MAGEGAKLATGWLELTVSTDGAQKSIMDGVLPGATAAGTQAGGRFGDSFGKVLAAGAVAGAVVVGFKKLYEIGSIFDEVTDTIRVGTGATGDALDALSESARNVGKNVPAGFEAAGSVVADLNTRLGLTGGTLETVASQYLEAGRILEQEVDIQGTSAAFSAFGIEGDAVSSSMDNLFRVSQATGVGMNELAAAAKAQAPALQILGFSFEDTISLAGSLDKAGLNSTAVMASMSKGLVTLAKDGEEPQAAFQRVTGEIETLLQSGDKAAAIDLASGIFGTRGATQFIGAVESGTVAFDDLMAATGASGDTILGVAAETRDFAESWTLVKNRGLDIVAPAAEGLFTLLSNGMSKLADFMGVLPGMASGLKSILGDGDFTTEFREAFGVEEDSPVVSFLLGMREAILGAMPAVTSIGAAVSSAFALIGPAFAPLMPVFAALIPQLLDLWQAFSPLSLIFQAIGPMLPQLVGAIAGLAASIGGALGSALTAIMPAITSMAGILVELLGGVLGMLLPVIVDLAGMLGPLLGTVLAAVMPLVMSLVGIVLQLAQAILPLLVPILGLIAPLAQLVVAILPPLIQLFVAILTPILGLASTLITLLVPVLQFVVTVLTAVVGWVAQAITWLVALVTGSTTAGAQLGVVWTQTMGMFADFFTNTIGMFSDFVTNALGFVTGLGTTLLTAFLTMWAGAATAVSTGVDNVVTFVTGLPAKVLAALGDMGSFLLDAGKDLMGGFVDGIKDATGGIGDAVGGVMDFVGGFFPHSPADRGPFSGSGWRAVKTAGLAIGDQFGAGLTDSERALNAQFDSMLTVPTSAAARLSSSGYSAAGIPDAQSTADQRPVEVKVYPQPRQSEEEIGNATAKKLNRVLRK